MNPPTPAQAGWYGFLIAFAVVALLLLIDAAVI